MGITVYHRETIVPHCSEAVWYKIQVPPSIPRNLAIKNKSYSTLYAGYYSNLFHMKTAKMLVFVWFVLLWYKLSYWSFFLFFWCDLLGRPSFTDLGMHVSLNYVHKVPMGKGGCPFGVWVNYFLSNCLLVI